MSRRLALRTVRRVRADLQAAGVSPAVADAEAVRAVKMARSYLCNTYIRRRLRDRQTAPRALMWSAYREAYRATRAAAILARRPGATQ